MQKKKGKRTRLNGNNVAKNCRMGRQKKEVGVWNLGKRQSEPLEGRQGSRPRGGPLIKGLTGTQGKGTHRWEKRKNGEMHEQRK